MNLTHGFLLMGYACCIIIGVLISVAYLTTAERKILGWMQGRRGPNSVGFGGMLQPLADGIKFIYKECIIPTHANTILFRLAPLMVVVPGWLMWAIVPIAPGVVFADIPLGILWILAMGGLASLGILCAGWASHSVYALLGGMRAVSQMIAYGVGLSLSLMSVVIVSGSMNLSAIVASQSGGIWHWWVWPLLPVCCVFWIASIAETHRNPFDVVEGESELVAGYHVEYSGMGFALFFIAEYGAMYLSALWMSLLFFGGWHSPFSNIIFLDAVTSWIPGSVWLLMKVVFWVFVYIWVRASLPRYRYDQIMYVGWRVLVPVALLWIPIVSFFMVCLGELS